MLELSKKRKKKYYENLDIKVFEDNKTFWRIETYHGPWLGSILLPDFFTSIEEAQNYLDKTFLEIGPLWSVSHFFLEYQMSKY